MGNLSFTEKCAHDLYDALKEAGWKTPENKPVIDPSTADLTKSVVDALGAAHKARATLLIAFIGHGIANPNLGFFLMAKDSLPAKLSYSTAFHMGYVLQQELEYCNRLDGLILLIDACETGQGITEAAEGWLKILALNRSRMDMLVASGTGSAYDGCFTRTILSIFKNGLNGSGDNLLCGNLQATINNTCVAKAQHLEFSGATASGEDLGLWLVPNVARSRDAVTGRPTAGRIDQLLSRVIVTNSMRKQLSAIEDAGSSPLRLVVGAAGSGKSTILALLIRPKKAEELGIGLGVADNYIKGAVFLDTNSTLETLAAELATQMAVTVAGFPAARTAVAEELLRGETQEDSAWEMLVIQPLLRCNMVGPVHLIVDGLDQPQLGERDRIISAVLQLTAHARAKEFRHVRLIVGVRSRQRIDNRPEFTESPRIEVTPPTWEDIAHAVSKGTNQSTPADRLAKLVNESSSGGWLIARLIYELADRIPGAAPFGNLDELVTARIGIGLDADTTGLAGRLLSLVVAAGVGPVLPICLLFAALTEREKALSYSMIRDVVVAFGTFVSRGHPGVDNETLGVSHQALLKPTGDYLDTRGYAAADAHNALISAYRRVVAETTNDANSDQARKDARAYWTSAAPRHYLEAGKPHDAIEFLESLDTARAADNRDRWTSWLSTFTAALGADHADTFEIRNNSAYWRGEAGDAAGALEEFKDLLRDQKQVLNNDLHPDILDTRNNLAHWRGEAGDAAGALEEFKDLLRDQERVLKNDLHPDILTTRINVASWRGRSGDEAGAVADLKMLLPNLVQVLGAADEVTLTARSNYAHWRGKNGDMRGAVDELKKLLPDQQRELSADHPDTLRTRSNLAQFQGETGDARGAVVEYEAVLRDRVRVLGARHPDTLATRSKLEYWREKVMDEGPPS
ncbi:tetratricopeptide repeat protein [Mycobacterium paraense]|uniref:tetratricopeptide repeat protein n=1 Tax=Mycobacterium paraense TaxID=767916 RepID=UPI001553C387|nr:tetratricopeptide repeat protein [Mycobacterium paraense]